MNLPEGLYLPTSSNVFYFQKLCFRHGWTPELLEIWKKIDTAYGNYFMYGYLDRDKMTISKYLEIGFTWLNADGTLNDTYFLEHIKKLETLK